MLFLAGSKHFLFEIDLLIQSRLKRCLRAVFTRFGIPEALVSDNAKEFTSESLNVCLKLHGIRKIESPIYFPRSNGYAERAVQTLKRALLAYSENKTHVNFTAFLQKSSIASPSIKQC